jgi:hypothetical protein
MILVSGSTDLFNIGHQFTNLGLKTFFCLLLKLGKITFKVSFFPVLFPFSIQCSLRNDRSIYVEIDFFLEGGNNKEMRVSDVVIIIGT